MKNKTFKILKNSLFLILILPCFLIFTACGSSSAYEIAKKNGFEGTEQEWLDSLKGSNGKTAYEIAVENGFVGTEEEWIESLKGSNGHDGTNGKDGQDAEKLDSYDMYQSAVKNNQFTGTYLEFLSTLADTNFDKTAKIISQNIFSVLSIDTYLNSSTTVKSSSGSGVLYKYNDDGSAYVITNYHVIYNRNGNILRSQKLYLYDQGEQTQDNSINAEYVGGAISYDIAVLKVADASKLKECGAIPITLANHKLGETCFAIGDTLERGISATKGIINRESEFVTTTVGNRNVSLRAIRHDCYINHGNSGGGLFNANGELIGITNGGSENTSINYAIPSNIVKSIAENVIENTESGKLTGLTFNLGLELTSSNYVSAYDPLTSSVVILEDVYISGIKSNSLASDYNSAEGKDNYFGIGDKLVSISIQEKAYPITRSFNLKELLLTARIGDTITITANNGTTDYSISLFLSSEYAITLN